MNLFDKMKPEYKELFDKNFEEYPTLKECIIKEMKEKFFWTDLKVMTADSLHSLIPMEERMNFIHDTAVLFYSNSEMEKMEK